MTKIDNHKAGPKKVSPTDNRKSNVGFASMDPQRQREIASNGGKKAHQIGHAYEFDSKSARAAVQKKIDTSRGKRKS